MYSSEEKKANDKFVCEVLVGDPCGVTQALKNNPDINLLSELFGLSNYSSMYGTALHYAIYKGNKDLCKLLLDNGADLNIPTMKDGKVTKYDALTFASSSKLDTFELIVKKSTVDISDEKVSEILENVIGRGKLELAEIVWTKYNFDKKQLTEGLRKALQEELFNATRSGNLDAIKFFINKGADPMKYEGKQSSPMAWALLQGKEELISFFIKNYSDISADKLFYLGSANKDNLTILENLFEHEEEIQQCKKENQQLKEKIQQCKKEMQQLFIDRLVSNIKFYGIQKKDGKIISADEYISEIQKLIIDFDVDLKGKISKILKILHNNYDAIAQVEISLIDKKGILPISYDDALNILKNEKDLDTEALKQVIKFYDNHPGYKIPGQYMRDHKQDISENNFSYKNLFALLSENAVIDNGIYRFLKNLHEASLSGEGQEDFDK